MRAYTYSAVKAHGQPASQGAVHNIDLAELSIRFEMSDGTILELSQCRTSDDTLEVRETGIHGSRGIIVQPVMHNVIVIKPGDGS